MADDDWKGESIIKNVPKSHDGQGRNFRVLSSREAGRKREATIQRLKPIIEELIDNCKENGYWEETKQRSFKRIAWEMINMTTAVEDEEFDDVIITLKRIKSDGIKW